MADELVGVDLKIGRAKGKLADLKDAIETRFDPAQYRFDLKLDPQTGKHVLTAHGVPEIDPEWSLDVGEILYNLRSALDQLAWQLVILDRRKPGENTQFPIRESPFNKKGKWLPPPITPQIKGSKILKALQEVQPYIGPDGTLDDYWTGPLWQVNKLNNIDKHRLLLVVVTMLDIGEMWWSTEAGERGPDFKTTTKPVTDGAPIAWFDFHGAEPPPDFDPHPALLVGLDEPAVPLGIKFVPIAGYLDMLCTWVGPLTIDTYFRPLFP